MRPYNKSDKEVKDFKDDKGEPEALRNTKYSHL